jgi:integrase
MENAYALCLLAGLREAECLGLSWDRVDFAKGTITIDQQLQKKKTKNLINNYCYLCNMWYNLPRDKL